MNQKSIIESVKEGVSEARSKAEMVAAHGQDVFKSGVGTAKALREVVVQAGRETVQLATRTKDELKRVLNDGAVQIGEKLVRIATPTRKEEAAARKAEVKALKQRKRAAMVDNEVAGVAA